MKFCRVSLVLVEGACPCVEVEVGLMVLVGGLSWVEVEVEGAVRVEEESLMTMLYDMECAVRSPRRSSNECLVTYSKWKVLD